MFITTARHKYSVWWTGITVQFVTYNIYIYREIYALICFAFLYVYDIISSMWTFVTDLAIYFDVAVPVIWNLHYPTRRFIVIPRKISNPYDWESAIKLETD